MSNTINHLISIFALLLLIVSASTSTATDNGLYKSQNQNQNHNKDNDNDENIYMNERQYNNYVGTVTGRRRMEDEMNRISPSSSSSSLRQQQQQQQQQQPRELFWNRCDRGRRTPYCVCDETELRDAINSAGNDPEDMTRINICTGEDLLVRTGSIDITGKSFLLSCFPWRFPGLCGLSGVRRNSTGPAFIGAPVKARFYGVYLEDFINDDEDTIIDNSGLGGAFYLTGGRTEFSEVQILYSEAVKGGAVYVTGTGTQFEMVGSTISNCIASESGGGLYVTGGANVTMERSGTVSNQAVEYGGFAVFDNAKGTILGSLFLNNTAGLDGDDLYIAQVTSPTTTPPLIVTCNGGDDPNEFCDGDLDGIVTAVGEEDSTDCVELGTTNGNSQRCRRWKRITRPIS